MTSSDLKTLKFKIDRLSPRAKQWLHGVAQQLHDSDAEGYSDHAPSRKECADANLITSHRNGTISMSSEVGDLLYSQGYLSSTQKAHT